MKKSNQNVTAGLFTEDQIIDRCTRAELIDDGVLTDITALAKEAGFKFPVAISAGIVTLINDAISKGWKDWDGIVWDILNVLNYKIKFGPKDNSRIDFKVAIWSKYTNNDQDVEMYSQVGPGDDMEPVITIMLPNED